MTHSIVAILRVAAILGCLSSSIYYFLCIWSAAAFLRQQKAAGEGARSTQFLPPVSILKPLKGTDPEIYESFRSHCLQDYPEFEIIFGVHDPNDPAIASVTQLQQEFPHRKIQLVVCPAILGPNVKVSNLAQMLDKARYDHLMVNDSDIRVEPDYLRRALAPLANQGVGMVTCLYRGVSAPTLGSRLEALGISSDFCAGVLVARTVEGGIRFGLGSTMAFRRADLKAIGGFASFVDYLADDYELGKRLAETGLTIEISDVVVETFLPAYNLQQFVAHQLRWARGVRDSRAGGYFGLVFTFGLMWSALAVIAAGGALWAWGVFAAVLLLRTTVAWIVGRTALEDVHLPRNLGLLPLRDLVGVFVWIASFFGQTVTWRGDRFELNHGKLTRIGS
jgi:ceramide glucosyltransferase